MRLTPRVLLVGTPDIAVGHEGSRGLDYIDDSPDRPRVLVVIIPRSIVTWGGPGRQPRHRS
jgi:hypothetical protein